MSTSAMHSSGPSSGDTPPSPAPKRWAARLSVMAPLSLVLIAVSEVFFFSKKKASAPDQESPLQEALILGTIVGLVVTGFIATFFALRSVYRHGRRGSPIWAVTGLLLNMALLLVWTGNFPWRLFERKTSPEQEATESARARKKAVDDMADFMDRLNQTMTSPTNTLSPEARLQFMSTEMARAASDTTGLPRLILAANSAFTGRMYEETDQFLKSSEAFNAGQVFLPTSNDTLQKIQHNRQLTQAYLEHNHSFSNFMSRALENYQADLKNYGVPEMLVRQQVESFADGFTWDSSLGEIRAGDGRIGMACLGILDIFEKNLGKWTNISPAIVAFPADADSENYVKLMREISAAAQFQREAKARRQSEE